MGEAIRILHVFGELNRGGAETMVMNIYRNIDRNRVQFDFIVHTKKKGSYEEEIHQLGGNIYRVPKYEGYNHIDYKKKWELFLQSHDEFKIIHGHVRSTASIYLKVAKKKGLITIAHSHSTSNGSGLTAIVKDIFQKPIKKIADYFFAASEESGKWLFGDKIIESDNFFIVKNAIQTTDFSFDVDLRKQIRDKYKVSDSLVFGHVGRFTEAKNHEFLIQVFNEVKDRNSQALLWLIGVGELENRVKKLVAELELEGSVFFFEERTDVNELMQAMDIFIFPSIFEGLGIVAIEAQASGLLTIVSDNIPEEADITDLFKRFSLNDSPQKWAKRILKFESIQNREGYSTEIANAGFDIENVAHKIEGFYLECYSDLGEKI